MTEVYESDASFRFLSHQVVISTNIDLEHMATYNNIYQTLLENFSAFFSK
ncbi:hypothetical protein IDZ49_10785 [Francisella tularensis]|nr:hypothetical protein [Francisella tularensis]